MIKFFRKIRYDLMEKNKTGKPALPSGRYLKYAVGEIMLVVIGILIALQINNWNGEVIRNKTEAILLNQLKADLTESQKEIEEVKSFYLKRAQASTKVLRVFWTPDELNDSIGEYMILPRTNRSYSPILGTARSLINSGNLDLIKSVELRKNIISYVEKVEYFLKDIQRFEETYYRQGVYESSRRIPNTPYTKEQLRKIQEEDITFRSRRLDSLDLDFKPKIIDEVPFQSNIEDLLRDENVYRAYYFLYLSHRNIHSKYEQIINITNDLLEKLNEINLD